MRSGILIDLAGNQQWTVRGVLAATVGVIVMLVRRENRRMKANERWVAQKCVHCGYDLRASDQRCPECGFPIQPPELPLTMALNRAALAQDRPAQGLEPRSPAADEFQVDVYASDEPMAVDLLARYLEARGIKTIVSTNHSESVDFVSFSPVERTSKRLSVWSGDVDRAVAMIHGLSGTAAARRSVADV
jgi:zinc-ribbon domain